MTKRLPEHTRRMAQLVNQPGGITAEEAVASAEQRLEGLRDRGLSDIADTIARIHLVGAGLRQQWTEAGCGELYRSSNSLIGIAGLFGKAGLGDVARSLCTLVERSRAAREWDHAAVQSHIDSLRLLSGTAVSPAQVAMVAAALRQLVDRLQPPKAPGRLN